MVRGVWLLLVLLAGLTGAYLFLRPVLGPPPPPAPPRLSAAARYAGLTPPLGQVAPDTVSLRDIYGNGRSLSEFHGRKAVVICFLGTACPVSNRLLPNLKRLERRVRPDDVQFLAVYSNEGETIDDAAAHAADFDIPFTVLKDHGQKLADALAVERTPEFCVLDAEGALVYRGRFSDQFGVGTTQAKAKRGDLDEALVDVLAGQKVRVSQTEADGCLLDRTVAVHSDRPVNFVADVAPILQQHCEVCHRVGGMGPFALSNFDDAKQWAEMIKEVTTQRRMPPWHADKRFGEWANDRRLTAEEIGALAAWVEQDAPPGDLTQFKPRTWLSEWLIGKPDVVLEAETSFNVPADGVVPYQYIWASKEDTDAAFSEDRWLVASDIKPSAPQVVHHLMIFAVEPGFPGPQHNYDGCRTAGAYLPGTPALSFPPGTAMRIPKGSRLSFEMHYTPNGKPAVDRPKVGLKFSSTPPDRELRIAVLQSRNIKIPPGEPNHMMEGRSESPLDSEMLALFPHQHMRGKSFKFVAHFPDGRHETLLSVPRMDYSWQTFYWFKDPPLIPKGTVIHCVAHWDNSAALLNNPDPKALVRWGPQSSDEMFVGWLMFIEKRRERP